MRKGEHVFLKKYTLEKINANLFFCKNMEKKRQLRTWPSRTLVHETAISTSGGLLGSVGILLLLDGLEERGFGQSNSDDNLW